MKLIAVYEFKSNFAGYQREWWYSLYRDCIVITNRLQSYMLHGFVEVITVMRCPINFANTR